MKRSNVLKTWAMIAALALPMVACDEDEPGIDDKPTVDPSTYGLLILNRGNYNANNASLNLYDMESAQMTDLYKTANGSALGESAQDMLVYGSKIYVGVTYSNRLAVLEKDGSLVKAIEPKDETGSPMNPRYMAAANGKVFAAYYSGHSVAVLDTVSLEIEKVIPVGRYPEQLVVANNKLYVANSGGGDYPNYGNTVSVIDLNTLAVEKEIEVVLNPVNMVADSEGDVYLASMGNYNQASEGQEAINNTLQRIDGQTGEVTVMGNGTKLAIANDKLYVIYANYYDTNITYKIYDAKKEQVVSENFITDGTKIASPNSIDVDPLTDLVYITNSSYGETASIYVFTPDGKLNGTPIDCGGYDTQEVGFLTK